jgi:type IV pilus assembly protein PilB
MWEGIVRFVSFLVRAGLLPEAEAAALEQDLDKAQNPLDVVARVVDERELAQAFAREFAVPVLELAPGSLDPAATALLPRDVARQHDAIPVGFDGTKLIVAVANPLDTAVISAIEFATRRKVTVAVAPLGQVREALRFTYDFTRDMMARVSEAPPASTDSIEILESAHDPRELESLLHDAGDRAAVVRLVELIVVQGLDHDASDIHIEPSASSVSIRYRIDGVMETGVVVPKALQTQLAGRIKVMAGLDIAERRKPQDGRISLRYEKRRVDVRVSALPTPLGEKIVLRLLDQEARSVSLASVGLSAHDLELLRREIHRPEGMVLISGPTGSGKTTTAHAILSEVATSPLNIVTIENPVEYRLKGVTQVEINERQGVTFAGTLRSILRQDPDVIFVGEIRDAETAEIALRAAQTGHLVISTVHTIDAASSTSRLLDLGVDPRAVASSLRLVIAQRLLRRVCPGCRAPHTMTDVERSRLGSWAAEVSEIVAGKGCSRCRGTGYAGRRAVYELLPVSAALRQLLEQRTHESALRAQARREGVRSMQALAIETIRSGATTVAEMLRVIPLEDEPATPPAALVAPAQAATTPQPQVGDGIAPVPAPGPRASAEGTLAVTGVEPTEETTVSGSEYTVLVVDDESINRSVIRHCLSKSPLPLRVVLADSARAAMQVLDTENVHLALFDLMMPDVSGIELCRRVRSDPRHAAMPIFMLSAVSELPEKTSAFAAGIDDYLTKPINGRELIARLTRALDRSYGRRPVLLPRAPELPPSPAAPAAPR